MSSRRHRSYSRERSDSPRHGRSRSRSNSPDRRAPLPRGVAEISESDYFIKSDEFRVWLKEEKNKVCHIEHTLYIHQTEIEDLLYSILTNSQVIEQEGEHLELGLW